MSKESLVKLIMKSISNFDQTNDWEQVLDIVNIIAYYDEQNKKSQQRQLLTYK